MNRYILPAALLLQALAFVAPQPARAQSSATTNISVATTSSTHNPQLRFTVASERNVREYRVMAGDNADALQEIARVKPEGFSAGPRTYKVPLAGTSFRCFKVCAVSMDGALCWGEARSADLPDSMPTSVEAVADAR